MKSQVLHRLLIYHSDSRIYKEILSKSLPQLEILSAVHLEEMLDSIEEAEIILAKIKNLKIMKGGER